MTVNESVLGSISRRTLMAGAAGTVAAGLVLPPRPSHAASDDPINQSDYDTMFDALNLLPRADHNESGAWAWAWGRVLISYLPMFLGYRETRYLDQFVEDADLLLAARDTERGVADHRGLSLPWWRVSNGYSTGSVVLPVGSGTVEFRIGRWGGNDGTAGTIEIVAGSSPDHYTLTVTDLTGTRVNRYEDVTLDPASSDYVVSRMFNDAQSANGTAADFRVGHGIGDGLPLGTHTFTTLPQGDLVNTGVLTTPLAWFARIVREDPELEDTYGEAADRYEQAVLDALECHDPEWQDGPGGTGWYCSDPDSPKISSGADLPHNQNMSVALTCLHLSRATRDPRTRAHARARACRILRHFRNDLRLEDGCYAWNYWYTGGIGYQGWTQTDGVTDRIPVWPGYRVLEDTSHSMLDIFTVLEAYEQRCVFTELDMQRFANTFADRMMAFDADGNPSVTKDVTGGGGVGMHDQATGVWIEFTRWRPEIADFLNELFRHKNYPPKAGYYSLSTAFVAAYNATH